MAIAFVSTTVSANNMVVASGSTATCISKDDNGSVSGRMSAGFRFWGFGFGDYFSPTLSVLGSRNTLTALLKYTDR
jgi:hypothetical protein